MKNPIMYKQSFTILLLLIMVSCNPRNVQYEKIIQAKYQTFKISNTGCSECFGLASNKVIEIPLWLDSISGSQYTYSDTRYSHRFWISSMFDSREVIRIIEGELLKRY
jgi:hypothetical protein